ncbi:MAG: EF-hand domain-containing protein [Gemmataceae bacterium]|nr:EF-hand domain-containing protein [Gemmataceae bacterium]MDW8266205.1 EF-hand domain-containing protein [Gemmataceae bacterium]
MIRLSVLTSVLTGLLLVAGAPGADDNNKPRFDPEAIFKKVDANGDGKLSKEEFQKITELGKGKGRGDRAKEMIGKLFEKLDANNDGSLSLDEYKKMREVVGEFLKRKKNNN